MILLICLHDSSADTYFFNDKTEILVEFLSSFSSVMIETQVLMTFSIFSSFFFKESFPGWGLHFSKGGGCVFQLGGFIFTPRVPHGGIGFDGGFRKDHRMGLCTLMAPHYGKPCIGHTLLSPIIQIPTESYASVLE